MPPYQCIIIIITVVIIVAVHIILLKKKVTFINQINICSFPHKFILFSSEPDFISQYLTQLLQIGKK